MMKEALFCVIVGISDGDTLTARCPDHAGQQRQITVRLAEIDAPESVSPPGRNRARR